MPVPVSDKPELTDRWMTDTHTMTVALLIKSARAKRKSKCTAELKCAFPFLRVAYGHLSYGKLCQAALRRGDEG